MQDYVTTKTSTCAYHMSSYICYEQLTSSYKIALNSYSFVVETSNFKEAVAATKWIETIELEIAELEENNT